MSQWWMSFCDPERPEGTQSLGVAIVPAPSFAMALALSHLNGFNPGGEVAAEEIPPDFVVPEHYLSRLLSMQEADAACQAAGSAGGLYCDWSDE